MRGRRIYSAPNNAFPMSSSSITGQVNALLCAIYERGIHLIFSRHSIRFSRHPQDSTKEFLYCISSEKSHRFVLKMMSKKLQEREIKRSYLGARVCC
ncbi:hypothetical protein CDAR_520671 [Caerostris darwini]|uniref:Uncharacterized protein n=1 Tax=Caerostris darwini TaxID=1538125 RepID=A0AAV4VLX8_9ARAC|nr:hypothetical protein CDAR_520671 [Caerostris darwini]